MVQNIAFILLMVIALYVGYMQYLFGPLYSISESWYKLKDLGHNRGWLFTLFCYTLSGLIIAVSGVAGGTYSVFFFLSGIGIAFTGAAAAFKMTGAATNIVHFTGAVVAIISALVAIGLVYGSWMPMYCTAITIAVLYILYLSKIIKRPVYWAELVALFYIVAGLLFLG